jgi:uncharacterized membrane protein
MTDENAQIGQGPKPKNGRWVKIILAVSLALNLAVVGVVAGVALKAHRQDSGRTPEVRELNFGPFTEALSRPQRREMLRDFVSDRTRLRALRDQIGIEFQAVLDAVRADPFDPAALEAALSAQSNSTVARLERGRMALQSVILGMTPEERLTYAERLERGLQRRHRDGGRDRDAKGDDRGGAARP